MERYRIIIIGGGFSGLIAAERLSEKYHGEVAVIERNERVGKKILATGNGRGNLTNVSVSRKNYHSVRGASVDYAIEKYGNKSIIDYFSSLGTLCTEEEGKVYPSSFQASSLLDCLREKILFNGGKELTGRKCLEIEKAARGFTVKTDGGDYAADKVVLSCGGKAQKQYGSDGFSYSLANLFGHKTTELYPSLVQIKTNTELIRGLKGIKAEAKVKAVKNGETLAESEGDVLFTDYGVSGNAVFFLSSYVTDKGGCELVFEFLPSVSERELTDFLVEKSRLDYLADGDGLSGVINKQLGRAILKKLGVKKLTAETAVLAAKEIKNFTLSVTGTLGFDYCQVTRGGIEFKGVDEKTFESKYAKGLYIIGEMLDVDGDCGGYNLQWAYSSARCMGDDLL